MTRVFEYMDCADRGLTVGETAARLGVSRQAVFIAADKRGAAFDVVLADLVTAGARASL